MNSLETVWEYREEQLYPQLFGTASRGIFPLTFELFNKIFAQHHVDPRWLHLGVFEFSPAPNRNSWLYATSGGSTPWESDPAEYDPESYSWLGVEFTIESPIQSDWPIQVLQRLLAYQVLLCHGRYGDVSALDYGHRLPVGGAIDGNSDSCLRFLAIAKPEHYPSWAQLPSGKFNFLHVVGITEAERDYAKITNTAMLISALETYGAYPVTNPNRAEIPL